MTKRALAALERDFAVSDREMKAIIRRFHREMDRGLSLRPGSLKMLPAYLDRPAGSEKGRFIALDLGGTNFRVLGVDLIGHGIISSAHVLKCVLHKKDITSTDKKLFAFLARSVKKFFIKEGIPPLSRINLGFTFSFPLEQEDAASGRLTAWTKGFTASGVKGHDVAALLKEALLDEGLSNVKVSALINDTVGTLAARSYSDRSCDIAVIIGTGCNACYVEKIFRIKRLAGRFGLRPGSMIINIEWGNFNKLKTTRYDKKLDSASSNPRRQIMEKMVSGLYLGEICRLVMMDLISCGELFGGKAPKALKKTMSLKGEHISAMIADGSPDRSGVRRALRGLGISGSTPTDRKAIARICKIVSTRAARISAAAIIAVATKIDGSLSVKHTVAIDGSVYEKLSGFSDCVKKTIKEFLGGKAGNIRLALTKDGSGAGAAIMAASAARQKMEDRYGR
ncbi:MAG: hexokinase [Candidatus Omnitrophica bacterium]|nr:hexokinase [Candidatus Omnitrophota bacterium]